MLNIAICDDDPVFLQEMEALLRRSRQVEGIVSYRCPEQLLEAAGQGRPFDTVFMDIAFEKDKSGIHCAEELYGVAPGVSVIYVTGYNDQYAQYVLLTRGNVIGYLTKPVNAALLSRYLDKAAQRQGGQAFLTFCIHGKSYSVRADDIQYIESRNHTVTVHVDGSSYVVYEKLSGLKERLPEQFVHCHKSFVVNMGQVSRLEPGCLILRGGQEIPVSKANAARTNDAFFRYIGGLL